MSTSKTERPSTEPGMVGSIAGCEGGARVSGRVEVSMPSSVCSVAEGWADALRVRARGWAVCLEGVT